MYVGDPYCVALDQQSSTVWEREVVDEIVARVRKKRGLGHRRRRVCREADVGASRM